MGGDARRPGLAARPIDLGDVTIVLGIDDTAEFEDEGGTQVLLVPRSPKMFRALGSLPKITP